MAQIKPKGTRDFLPNDTLLLQIIESMLRQAAETSCYREIRTPFFEHTDVFVRSSGEASDIVNKEMYTFLDKGNRSISLRPEGTAGVIRSFVENKMYVEADFPIRLYYVGPNFRYERPQAGRFRQFSQFGIENIGLKTPYIDAETIFLATDMLASIGITDIKVKINSIGDLKSRENYKEALREYFKDYIDDLCEDCKVRYEKNPLRILDCKVDYDKECMKNYPVIKDYLSDESKEYFKAVLEQLDKLGVIYEIDEKLVRGLDYYNDVVFEISASSPSGTDYGAVLGGGRYDHLIEQFDGPSLPAFGFGLGVDRCMEICKELGTFDQYKDRITCYIMPRDDVSIEYGFFIMNYLRYNGVDSDMDYQARSIKSQFKTVDRKNALFSLVIGEEEANQSTVNVRDNRTKEQVIVAMADLIPFLSSKLSGHSHSCGCGCEDHEHEEGCGCGCHEHSHDHECECGCHEHDHNHECECGCHEHEENECEDGCCCHHKER